MGARSCEPWVGLAPDVVLMDLKMTDVGGVEATRLVLRECPHVGVVVLTMVEDDDAVFAAMRAGARGYLLKGARRSRSCERSGRSPTARGSSDPPSRVGSCATSRRPGRPAARRRFPS